MFENERLLVKYAVEFNEKFMEYYKLHLADTLEIDENAAEWYDVMVSFIDQETYYKAVSDDDVASWLLSLLSFYGTLALHNYRGLRKMKAHLILSGLILPALLIDSWEDRH